MAKSIETQGVTVEEAIQVALNQLGVSRDRVEIEIIHHPRSGIFGIGARRAKIRATLREIPFADGEEYEISGTRRRRARRGRRGRRRSARPETRVGQAESAAAEGAAEARQRKSRGSRQRQAEREESGEGQRPEGNVAPPEAQAPEEMPSAARLEERTAAAGPASEPHAQEQGPVAVAAGPAAAEQGAEGASRAEATGQVGGEEAARASEGKPDQPEEKPPLSAEEVGERALAVVREVLRRMGFEATVALGTPEAANEVLVDVHCDADGLLIGRHGQTLDSFEHLVNRMVLAGENSDLRIVIDVGGYRQRRRDSLLELADRLKVRALTQGKRVQVSPMSPRDRRVFQSALAGDDTVSTQVLGSGFYRRVMIVPVGLEDEQAPVEEVGHEADRRGDDGSGGE